MEFSLSNMVYNNIQSIYLVCLSKDIKVIPVFTQIFFSKVAKMLDLKYIQLMMRKFNLFSKVYTMGYLWDLNFTIEYFFYSRIFEKTPVKKNIHIAINNLFVK